MDQIVAQALTTYGKIAGMRRVEAMVQTQSNGKSNGNGAGLNNGNGNGHRPTLDSLEIPGRVMTAVDR
jgi:hypothetical protein